MYQSPYHEDVTRFLPCNGKFLSFSCSSKHNRPLRARLRSRWKPTKLRRSTTKQMTNKRSQTQPKEYYRRRLLLTRTTPVLIRNSTPGDKKPRKWCVNFSLIGNNCRYIIIDLLFCSLTLTRLTNCKVKRSSWPVTSLTCTGIRPRPSGTSHLPRSKVKCSPNTTELRSAKMSRKLWLVWAIIRYYFWRHHDGVTSYIFRRRLRRWLWRRMKRWQWCPTEKIKMLSTGACWL